MAKQLNLDEDIQDQLHYQESVLAWTRNDHEIGRSILRNLLRKPSLNPNLKVQVLRVYGDWMAETKSENPQVKIIFIRNMKKRCHCFSYSIDHH